jgi:hypothetical protein
MRRELEAELARFQASASASDASRAAAIGRIDGARHSGTRHSGRIAAAFARLMPEETRMIRSIARASLSLAVLTMALVCVDTAHAQAGPEQKKLEYLVGKWKTDVDIKASAASPGGKAAGSEDCEWFANLHVVCRAESSGAAGSYRTMRVISYVPALKAYSQYAVDSLGYAVLSAGQLQGNVWTFTTELPGMKLRTVMKTSNDGYTTTSEYAGADGKFAPTGTGKASRVK